MDDIDLTAELTAYHREGFLHPDPAGLRDAVMDIPSTTPPPRSFLSPFTGRFQSIFSASKLVVAGAIVALFGGFLLVGVMTQPSDEMPPVVGASASADLATAEPSEQAVSETTIRGDFLPGVDLVTEEIKAGVFRVLDDGHRDLRSSVWDVAVSGTGDVWVDRLVDGTRHFARLGSEQEYPLAADDADPVGGALSVDQDGSVRAAHQRDEPNSEMTFDGEAWVRAEYRLALRRGGTGDAVEGDGFRASVAVTGTALEIVRETGGGVESARVDPPDHLFGLREEAGGMLVAPGSDGTIWVSQNAPGSKNFVLGRFDGTEFDVVETWGPSGPSTAGLDDGGQNRLHAIAEAPDGTLWVSNWRRSADVLYVWSWDGAEWTAYEPLLTRAGAAWPEVSAGAWTRHARPDGPRTGTWFAPDGSIWFDGLVHFDGARFTPLDVPVASADGTTVVSAISVAPDGTIWIVMVGGYPEGCDTSYTCGTSAEGLYVITDEAVAGTADGAIVVAQDGSGTTTTITEAVAMAEDGDTILVRPGTYDESVVLDKDLTIRGDGDRDEVVVELSVEIPPGDWDGPDPDLPTAFLLGASDAKLENLTLRGESSRIVINGGTPEIRDLVLDGVGRVYQLDFPSAVSGLHVYGGSEAMIANNVLTDTDMIIDGSSPTLFRNAFSIGALLIDVGEEEPGRTEPVIRENTIDGSVKWGIAIWGGARPKIVDNTIRDALNGVEVEDPGTAPSLRGNTISGSRSTGISVRPGAEPEIELNVLIDNGVGISTTGAEPFIQANELTDNGVGISTVDSDAALLGNAVSGGGSGIVVAGGSPTLQGNEVSGADRGLVLGRGATPTLEGNIVCRNTADLVVPEGVEPPVTTGNEICGDTSAE